MVVYLLLFCLDPMDCTWTQKMQIRFPTFRTYKVWKHNIKIIYWQMSSNLSMKRFNYAAHDIYIVQYDPYNHELTAQSTVWSTNSWCVFNMSCTNFLSIAINMEPLLLCVIRLLENLLNVAYIKCIFMKKVVRFQIVLKFSKGLNDNLN